MRVQQVHRSQIEMGWGVGGLGGQTIIMEMPLVSAESKEGFLAQKTSRVDEAASSWCSNKEAEDLTTWNKLSMYSYIQYSYHI